jgi:hypothetical protein
MPFIASTISPLTVIRNKDRYGYTTEMCVLTGPAPAPPLAHGDDNVVTTVFNVFALKNIRTATEMTGGELPVLGHPMPAKSLFPPPNSPGGHALVVSGSVPRAISQIEATPKDHDTVGGSMRATIVFVTAPAKATWDSDWARLGSVQLDVLTGAKHEFENAQNRGFLDMWKYIKDSASTICHLVENSVGDLRAQSHTQLQALRKHNTRTHTRKYTDTNTSTRLRCCC